MKELSTFQVGTILKKYDVCRIILWILFGLLCIAFIGILVALCVLVLQGGGGGGGSSCEGCFCGSCGGGCCDDDNDDCRCSSCTYMKCNKCGEIFGKGPICCSGAPAKPVQEVPIFVTRF
jgi:hypothetical protein